MGIMGPPQSSPPFRVLGAATCLLPRPARDVRALLSCGRPRASCTRGVGGEFRAVSRSTAVSSAWSRRPSSRDNSSGHSVSWKLREIARRRPQVDKDSRRCDDGEPVVALQEEVAVCAAINERAPAEADGRLLVVEPDGGAGREPVCLNGCAHALMYRRTPRALLTGEMRLEESRSLGSNPCGFCSSASYFAALQQQQQVPATLSAASSSRALPDCLGHPKVRPTDILFTCADGGFGVDRLSWVTWGGSRAVGLGSAYVNDCTPSCAAGHFHRFPAVVIATGLQRCPNGEAAYLTVTWAFIGRSPFPSVAPGTKDPRQAFRCSPP